MIHFEVQTKKGERADYGPTVSLPNKYPSFVLVFNNDWNDYSYQTWFCLYYYGEDRKQQKIGEFKLMRRGEKNTINVLGKAFDGPLSNEFCSLGIEPEYYSKIYELFGDTNIMSELLTDLCDCAYNQNIYEDFCEDECFKLSLLREDSSGQAVKEAAFLLSGKDRSAAYSFEIHFAPEYLSGAYTDWTVKLIYDAPPFMRTVGLIGNNGVGKTQMLKELASNLIQEVKQTVDLPLFRSCLVISSTPFDEYDKINVENPRIPFKIFTFEQNKQDLLDSIHQIAKRPLVHRKPMILRYKENINEVLGEEASNFLVYNKDNDYYQIDEDEFYKVFSVLSSGQLIIFYLLTFIHAHIHLTSLLIIDEPEVHMHPQIIVSFMSMLGHILNKFRSFAIIATHSPLVVREMVGQNVFLMRTIDGKIPNVSKVAFETFGADASELYYNIFNYDERISSFHYYVKTLGRKTNYEGVVKYIQKYAPGLGLNARLSIRDFLEERENA